MTAMATFPRETAWWEEDGKCRWHLFQVHNQRHHACELVTDLAIHTAETAAGDERAPAGVLVGRSHGILQDESIDKVADLSWDARRKVVRRYNCCHSCHIAACVADFFGSGLHLPGQWVTFGEAKR